MSKEAVVILPVHLFEKHPCLKSGLPIYIVEFDRYFSDFAFHKQKLLLHRATMKFYEKYLKSKKYNVTYEENKEAADLFKMFKKKGIEKIHFCDPADHALEKELKAQAQKNGIKTQIVDSPFFNTSRHTQTTIGR